MWNVARICTGSGRCRVPAVAEEGEGDPGAPGGGRARDCVVPRLSPVPLCPSRCPQPLPLPRADSPPPQPGCRRRRRVPGRSPGPAAAASSRICRRGGGPRASPPLAGLFFPVLAPAGEVGRAKGGGTPFPPPPFLSLPLLRSTWEAKLFLLAVLLLLLAALRRLPSPRCPPGPPPGRPRMRRLRSDPDVRRDSEE